HISARTLFPAVNLHDIGMAEPFADRRLALKAVEEDGIGFHVGVGNFKSYGAIVAQVGGAINGSHAAARNRRLDMVEIDLAAGFQRIEKTHRAVHSTRVHFNCIGKEAWNTKEFVKTGRQGS